MLWLFYALRTFVIGFSVMFIILFLSPSYLLFIHLFFNLVFKIMEFFVLGIDNATFHFANIC